MTKLWCIHITASDELEGLRKKLLDIQALAYAFSSLTLFLLLLPAQLMFLFLHPAGVLYPAPSASPAKEEEEFNAVETACRDLSDHRQTGSESLLTDRPRCYVAHFSVHLLHIYLFSNKYFFQL